MYKTLIRPVLMCGSETWSLTKNGKYKIAVCERKFLRSILGGVKENDLCQSPFNFEIYRIFKEPDII